MRWGRLRGDLVASSLTGLITVCETKSCKSDYLTDSKWQQYLRYCNYFYFVFTSRTYESLKDRLKTDLKGLPAGVLVLSTSTGYLECKIRPRKRLMTRRDKMNMLARLAWRGGISKRTSRRTRIFINE